MVCPFLCVIIVLGRRALLCMPDSSFPSACVRWQRRYSTGWGVSGSDALIQDFYALECQNPVRPCSKGCVASALPNPASAFAAPSKAVWPTKWPQVKRKVAFASGACRSGSAAPATLYMQGCAMSTRACPCGGGHSFRSTAHASLRRAPAVAARDATAVRSLQPLEAPTLACSCRASQPKPRCKRSGA